MFVCGGHLSHTHTVRNTCLTELSVCVCARDGHNKIQNVPLFVFDEINGKMLLVSANKTNESA